MEVLLTIRFEDGSVEQVRVPEEEVENELRAYLGTEYLWGEVDEDVEYVFAQDRLGNIHYQYSK